jgi:aryl-alcohol dehydrogenase-like predicted oxidoreductase
MRYVPVGKTNRQVSKIGLGCVTFGREIDETTSFKILDHAREVGITLLDTAEAYGGFEARNYRREVLGISDVREVTDEPHSSERIIGRWLRSRGCHNEVVVQTKVARDYNPSGIARALAGSLDRLGIDAVDMYLLHNFESKTPLEETLHALAEEVRASRIRSAGCSNFNAQQLRAAIDVSHKVGLPEFEVLQMLYNLAAERRYVDRLLAVARNDGMLVVGFSPLGAGFLTGKYSPDTSTVPPRTRFHVIPGHVDLYFSPGNFGILERLREKSATTGIPMAHLSLGWALRNPDVPCVLIGARSTEQIDNAITALEMEFPEEWLTEMNGWSQSGSAFDGTPETADF